MNSKIFKFMKKIILPMVKAVKNINKFTKVNEKNIMFISFHGRGYSDNPKAIYEELINNSSYNDYNFIWAMKNPGEHNFDNVRTKVVRYRSIKYFYYLGICKFWVFNCRMPEYLTKKKGQVYLQTWHGTPLKRLAHDIKVSEDTSFFRSEITFDEMTKAYDIDVEKYDYMISPNSFTSEVFPSAFRVGKDKLIETGYPRNDILINLTPEEVLNLKLKFKIPENKKVILYAPTWRDNSYATSGYTFELIVDFHRWKEILGDEYIIIFKPHYLISNKFNLSELTGFVYTVSSVVDINELYLISDALITDYSSVFFDYAILNRPIYFYMYDLDEYKNELRGFYLDIYTEIPGVIYKEEEGMLLDIRKMEFDYRKLDEFNSRFNNMEDGEATKRVVEVLFNNVR